MKPFGQFKIRTLRHFPTAFLEPFDGVGMLEFFHLAGVTLQGLDFAVEGIGDIRLIVDVFGTPEENFGHLVRLKTRFE